MFKTRDMLPAIGFSAVAAFLFLALTLQAPARGDMAVAFPPFTDEATAFALVRDAGGHVVGPTRVPGIVVAHAVTPDFQDRIRSLGALFFLKATGLCTPILT